MYAKAKARQKQIQQLGRRLRRKGWLDRMEEDREGAALPEAFLEKMERLLGEEYGAFLESGAGAAPGPEGKSPEAQSKRGGGSQCGCCRLSGFGAGSLGGRGLLLWGFLPSREASLPSGRALLYPGAQRHDAGQRPSG